MHYPLATNGWARMTSCVICAGGFSPTASAASHEPGDSVNGTLNLTRVSYDRQFESDPPSVSAVLPARGKNGDQTFSSSLTFGFAACGLAMMPARRLSLSL
jgi:hypothetical protein